MAERHEASDHQPGKAAAKPKRRWWKWTWRIALAIVVLVAGWWAALRLTAPGRSVTRLHIEQVTTRTRQAVPDRLRLGIYNIAHGRGTAASSWRGGSAAVRRERLDEIAQWLAAANLDVVVLNEVDFECTWSQDIDQAKTIAVAAGYPYVVEQTNLDTGLPGLRFRYGNAVLSRLPVVANEFVDWPAYSEFESFFAGKKRGLVCTLELADERRFRLLAVHLEHRSEPFRIAAAKQIEKILDRSELPLVCAGDFNSSPVGFPLCEPDAQGQTALSLLEANGEWDLSPRSNPSARELTFPSTAPDRLLDWILIPTGWSFVEYEVPMVMWSDHFPVVAEVSIPAQ